MFVVAQAVEHVANALLQIAVSLEHIALAIAKRY